MWEISNFSQLTGFLYSAILGALYCVLYDLVRSFRKINNSGTVSVFFQDIIFFIICGFTCFCFLLSVTNGEIRAYVLFGIAFGFLIFRLTLSNILFYIFKKCFSLIKCILAFINRFFSFINKSFSRAANVFSVKVKYFLKNSGNSCKKLLKKVYGLLYTKNN